MDSPDSSTHPPAPVPVFPSTITATTPVAGTPLDITRVIQVVYADIEAQINRADLKAQITLSTAAILAAMVMNLGLGIATRELRGWSVPEWCAALAYLGFLGFLGASLIHALLAAYPRAMSRQADLPANPNLYFSGHIVTLGLDDYTRRFEQQSNAEVLTRLVRQLHAKSHVLEAKLAHIRRGLKGLGVALLLWLLARGLLLLAYGRLPLAS